MIIIKADIEDAKEILELQKLAYISEAEIINDFTIAPLTQNFESIEMEFKSKTFLKAVENGVIIGSVRILKEGDTCYVGRLIVHPDFQNKGIGTRLMNETEKNFNCKRYELFTGFKSEKNLYLYKKLGYRIFKEEVVNEKLKFFYLEKPGMVDREKTASNI